MGALLMLALMAIPLSEAQYAPDGTAALVRFLESSHMFRSVLEQQPAFGPMQSQQSRQVQTCTLHALLAAHDDVPEFFARVRMESLMQVHNVETMRTEIASFGTLGSRAHSMARWRRVATVLALTPVLLCACIACTACSMTPAVAPSLRHFLTAMLSWRS